MKNKLLTAAVVVIFNTSLMNCNQEDEKKLHVKKSEQQSTTSFYSKLSEHKTQAAIAITGLAVLCYAINILSDHNLENSDIYSVDYKNPLFFVGDLTTLGIGLLWYAFTMPAPEKIDHFVETTH